MHQKECHHALSVDHFQQFLGCPLLDTFHVAKPCDRHLYEMEHPVIHSEQNNEKHVEHKLLQIVPLEKGLSQSSPVERGQHGFS